nr:hypothetical protein [Citrobacter freundii]
MHNLLGLHMRQAAQQQILILATFNTQTEATNLLKQSAAIDPEVRNVVL